eukprot:GHUV01007521.1.p1 GENE.GHUV01007521.1~~GHUV01007521.1.p1  ORF type:complete len:169 (+),score=54.61 GHUV01007521.1:323-829(+)
MARYGKLLLQRLTFQYCDRMGSSQGMREYIEHYLPSLKESVKYHNPHIQILTEPKRNRFPLVKAEYAPLANSSLAHLEKQLQQPAMQYAQQALKHSRRRQQEAAAEAPRLNSNIVGLKHLSAAEIKSVVWWLTQSQGRPATTRVPNKHIRSRRCSIQGAWTPNTFATP